MTIPHIALLKMGRKLADRNTQQAAQLVDATDKLQDAAVKLAHVEGHREGSDSERDRDVAK